MSNTITISKLESLAIKVKHTFLKEYNEDIPYKECLEIAEEILSKRKEDISATDVLQIKPYKKLTKHDYQYFKYLKESIKPKRPDLLKKKQIARN